MVDRFYTPKRLARRIVYHYASELRPMRGYALEPSSGGGSFAEPLSELTRVLCLDTDPDASYPALCTDYLSWTPREAPRAVIGNPPYSLAREFVEHSYQVAHRGAPIVFLLRLAFLESVKRRTLWETMRPFHVYVLTPRPSFTGKGTDATAYAVFEWRAGMNPRTIELDWMHNEGRW